MPHLIVKLHSGRSEELKKRLAEAVTLAVTSTLGLSEATVSVALEEFSPERWAEDVYKPDILEGKGTIYKQPGYNPFR